MAIHYYFKSNNFYLFIVVNKISVDLKAFGVVCTNKLSFNWYHYHSYKLKWGAEISKNVVLNAIPLYSAAKVLTLYINIKQTIMYFVLQFKL